MAKKRKTNLAQKNFLNPNLLNVPTVRNKCYHLRDFVRDNYVDIFCLSEHLQYDDESANLKA